jgi:N,N'-diacetyllegionaminate synthase
MNKTFIVAEVAQAHDGSLGILHSYIDALSSTGVDAIKFQTHIAEAESSEFEDFRVKFSYVDNTRYDYWKRMSFTLEQWKEIKKHCDEKGLEFMSSPFSLAAVDLLEKVGVQKYKIGSGEVSNFLLLKKVALTGKEIILSSGMSSFNELKESIKFIKQHTSSKITILQCTTQYPTPIQDVGLNVIPELKNHFNCSVGLSDHSASIYPSLAAATLGASFLEFHVTFDRRSFGPDALSSLTIEETCQLVKGVRDIEKMMFHKVNKNDVSKYQENRLRFGKTLAVNKNLKEGHTISFEDLESKKPAQKGIAAQDFESVLGKKINKDLKKWNFLTREDILE